MDPKSSDGAKRDLICIYDDCASALYQMNVTGVRGWKRCSLLQKQLPKLMNILMVLVLLPNQMLLHHPVLYQSKYPGGIARNIMIKSKAISSFMSESSKRLFQRVATVQKTIGHELHALIHHHQPRTLLKGK